MRTRDLDRLACRLEEHLSYCFDGMGRLVRRTALGHYVRGRNQRVPERVLPLLLRPYEFFMRTSLSSNLRHLLFISCRRKPANGSNSYGRPTSRSMNNLSVKDWFCTRLRGHAVTWIEIWSSNFFFLVKHSPGLPQWSVNHEGG